VDCYSGGKGNHMSEVARLKPREADAQEELSLPGWVYRDPEYFRVEMARLIRPAWQIVCHANDIAKAGEWRTLEILSESILVIRGDDGAPRAFANVCRHRGSRLVDGEAGCARRLTCPYNAWTYASDGRLVGVPSREDYPGLDPAALGLIPVELENWRGFLFVRLEAGGPSVAEMMAPHDVETAPHRFEELEAIGRITMRPRDVNWKNVADNYSDGLHIKVAHPGLTRLFGGDYRIEAGAHVDRMSGELVERPSANLSERAYQALLPAEAGRTWLLQALAQRRDRHLSGPGGFHALRPGRPDPDDDPRGELRRAGRRARDEGGALPQLADQPPRQRGGHGADPPRPAGHGLGPLYARPARAERGVPEELRAQAQAADSGDAAGEPAPAWLERFARRMSR